MKKAISLVLILVMCLTLCIPAFATEKRVETTNGFTFNGEEMAWILCDTEGNMVDSYDPLSRDIHEPNVQIPNGYTMFFYNSTTNKAYQFLKDTHVSVVASWSTQSSFIIGYDVGQTGTGSTSIFDTGSQPTSMAVTGFDVPKTAGYIFWVTNMSSDTKTLTRVEVTTGIPGQ